MESVYSVSEVTVKIQCDNIQGDIRDNLDKLDKLEVAVQSAREKVLQSTHHVIKFLSLRRAYNPHKM